MDDSAFISAAQVRAARALLGWSQAELAAASELSRRTVASVELGEHQTYAATLVALKSTFEREGIVFIDEDGREGVTTAKSPAD